MIIVAYLNGANIGQGWNTFPRHHLSLPDLFPSNLFSTRQNTVLGAKMIRNDVTLFYRETEQQRISPTYMIAHVGQ